MPWFDTYEAAAGKPTGKHVHTVGPCTCIPEPSQPFLRPVEPDDGTPLVPAMPSLLGWIVALIVRR